MVDPIERRILLVAPSGWVNRHQHEVSDDNDAWDDFRAIMY
jgi:hypothetical protein